MLLLKKVLRNSRKSIIQYFCQNPKEILKRHQFQRSWAWRGKVIGGTGAINTMLYMRGNAKDYDNWASLGNSGWSFRDCLPYFRKLEDMRHPQLQHGKKYL